nr:hypothetical protein [Tanacetum cinerariifolium]
MINAQVDDLSSHNTKYTSPALTQKAIEDDAEDEDDDNGVSAEPTLLLPMPATLPPSPIQEHIPSPPQTAQPSLPPLQQPSQTDDISQSVMTLLNTLLETCATLTKEVANLEKDKLAQAIKITKLKQREDTSKQGEGIAELDADEEVTLMDVEEDLNADVQGRLTESQAKVYHMDLQHANTVLSMQDTDEAEPSEVEEVIEVVTTAKLMTEGVVIQDPEEIATASVIVHSEVKSKDKGNGILIEEPKPLKRQMDFFKGMTNNDIRPIFEKHYNSIKDFLEKEEKEIEEEENKRKGDSLNQDATKKKRINEETEYGLEKVKSWKRFESCRVYILTLTTTQMISLVEKKYPLTRFTLEQMLNNVRLEVEEESEMSLELLRLVRRQLQEGYIPELEVWIHPPPDQAG